MKEQTGLQDPSCGSGPDKGATFLDYWRVIRRRWKMVGGIVLAAVAATVVISLLMPEIYQARAVITPVAMADRGGGGAGITNLVQQFGGSTAMAISGSTTAAEVVSLLRSNVLRAEIVRQFDLLPVLFYGRWDAQRRTWKKEGARFDPLGYLLRLADAAGWLRTRIAGAKETDAPGLWDGLRVLDERVNVLQDLKLNTVTLTVEAHDPDVAARIADHFLVTLTNHMSREAKRVAMTNRKYLEQQLGSTADPFIKQKTYNMIAQQIEAGMMAEVNENFAFKVIDPPLAPDRKIKPKRVQMVMLSFFGAMLAAVFLAFIMEYLGNIKAKDREVCR